MIISRESAENELKVAVARSPVVLLTGARQTGKSTLVQKLFGPSTHTHYAPVHFFDLENPSDLARLSEPMLALENLDGTVIIDEAQHRPDLFPVLRVLVDQNRKPGRFILLGSAAPELVGLSSESLAGRITFVELGGLSFNDVLASSQLPATVTPLSHREATTVLSKLWLRGGLPLSYLADSETDSCCWRDDYISTFLERDLAALGFDFPAATMRRFWTMLAHYHSQVLNTSELARSIAVSQPTVRRYLDALTDALVVRQLQPWHANISKRQVRSPRIYLRDSGLVHRLLGISDLKSLESHPKLGASWEGLVVEQLCRLSDSEGGKNMATFWSTHTGAEVDLRLEVAGRIIGVEVKRSATPRTSKSMHSAIESLELDELVVVHSGEHSFPLTEKIRCVPATQTMCATTLKESLQAA